MMTLRFGTHRLSAVGCQLSVFADCYLLIAGTDLQQLPANSYQRTASSLGGSA